MPNELLKLYKDLKVDKWRRDNKFSDDITLANELLFDPYSTMAQCEIQLLNWLQRFQPCVFGRIAAAKGYLHFCIIRDTDLLTKSDEEIASLIREELLRWKQRSITPQDGFSTPAHGFILSVLSPRVAFAAPDDHLKEFAVKLQTLWGCTSTDTSWGTVFWEDLFLQHPNDKSFVKFSFSVDFFASQGDGRWWQDHRSPGGILFTANSVGHMMRYREWYQNLRDQREWILQSAMLTIDNAVQTPYGRATWLKELGKDKKPIVRELECPFSNPERIKINLVGKDWTRYGGYLHTDLSIRDEFFFHEDPAPKPDIIAKEYLQDFAYLFDKRETDHLKFVEGSPISPREIEDLIGSPSSWTQIANRPAEFRKWSPSTVRGGKEPDISIDPIEIKREREQHAMRIQQLLKAGDSWRLSEQELSNLSGAL
jgi:hypothetical protein